MNIKELIKQAHENAVDKGFYECPECCGSGNDADNFQYGSPVICNACNGTGKDPNKNIGELLMLIVSELGEALEAHRKGKFADWGYLKVLSKQDHNWVFEGSIKDTFEDEIADVFIRLFDLCGYLEIDIEKHIQAKMVYNKTRPYKHNKEY